MAESASQSQTSAVRDIVAQPVPHLDDAPSADFCHF
jgi:hypothetical protein